MSVAESVWNSQTIQTFTPEETLEEALPGGGGVGEQGGMGDFKDARNG